jgi:hypothetical protein
MGNCAPPAFALSHPKITFFTWLRGQIFFAVSGAERFLLWGGFRHNGRGPGSSERNAERASVGSWFRSGRGGPGADSRAWRYSCPDPSPIAHASATSLTDADAFGISFTFSHSSRFTFTNACTDTYPSVAFTDTLSRTFPFGIATGPSAYPFGYTDCSTNADTTANSDPNTIAFGIAAAAPDPDPRSYAGSAISGATAESSATGPRPTATCAFALS